MNSNINKKKFEPEQQEVNLILGLFNQKKNNELKKILDDKIKKYPNSSILFNILGAFYAEENKLEDAVIHYKKSIKINSRYAQAYNNLGIALHKLNQITEAIKNYEKAINIKDNFAEAFNNLGNANRDINKPKDALKFLEKALQYRPDYAEAYNNVGATYEMLDNRNEALKNYRKALEIKPEYVEVYNNLGMLFNDTLEFEESLIHYNKAIELNPNYEKSYNNLGNLLSNLGNYETATEKYHQAINIKPDYAKAYSNLLFNLNYKVKFDYNEYLLIAKKFRINCEKLEKKINIKYIYEKKPKKLNIGFLSADFGNHPGGFFTLSTLRELKKKNLNLIAYSVNDRRDEFSHHFKPLFNKWHLVDKMSNEEIIEKILKDGVHILIDVQGHSAKNRLPIFIHKPAPIQASWLGQGSTGIPEIDYFIGSPHITPKKEEKYYVEKVYRLPEISQCFTTPDFEIKVSELPLLKNQFVTFGSVNKLTKVNDDVVKLWSKILLSIPNSKLILKNNHLDNKKILEKTLLRFKKNNVDENRLLLLGHSKTRKELLETYNKIDIALDPFPFQGNTTTCESIWMGVPVLTLKGDRYLFHFGESINSNLDMQDWIAKDCNDYINKAINFSSKTDHLSKVRKNLREKCLKSPVFDQVRFAEYFSNMLWEMWKNFSKK